MKDIQIKQAKPKADGKVNIITDTQAASKGLRLLVLQGTGTNIGTVYKHFEFRYELNKKSYKIRIGSYPAVSLSEARAIATTYRSMLVQGKNPKDYKDHQKEQLNNTFKLLALEWLESKKSQWKTAKSYQDAQGAFTLHIFPSIGDRSIADLTIADITPLLDKLHIAGKANRLIKVRQTIAHVFDYAIIKGLITTNPVDVLRRATHYATPNANYAHLSNKKDIADLLHAIDRYHGAYQTKMALTLASHLFLRPTELCELEWSEVDLSESLITIKATRMKMGKAHLIPLSKQAYAMLSELHKFSGDGKYVFPSPLSKSKPLTCETLSKALRVTLGFNGKDKPKHVTHGFRHLASTALHENSHIHGVGSDAIERQLAHVDGNKIKGTYNKAEYINERVRLMQWWSDYLDNLKHPNNLVEFKQA